VSVLEDRIADLSGGSDAVATGSGMAAFDAITTVLASAGDNVVASSEMYGGTAAYLTSIANRRGVEARLVDTLDDEAYADAIDDDTAFVHVETVANPSLVTPDFERLAEIAHENAVPLVVDNTFATPYLCRPFEHGADIVWESTTKWITGNGTTVGGIVVDGGQFPWDHPDADYDELDGQSPPTRSTSSSGSATPPSATSPGSAGAADRRRPAVSRRSTRGRRFRGSTRPPAPDGAPLRTPGPSPSSSKTTTGSIG